MRACRALAFIIANANILVFANRLGRAAFKSFKAQGDLFLGHWLPKDEALADVVVPTEMIGSGGRAEAAVGAGGIDVETSGDVLRQAIEDIGHEVFQVG